MTKLIKEFKTDESRLQNYAVIYEDHRYKVVSKDKHNDERPPFVMYEFTISMSALLCAKHLAEGRKPFVY